MANFTQQYEAAKKSNPKLSVSEFQKTYASQSTENADYLNKKKQDLSNLAQKNLQTAQKEYAAKAGPAPEGQVYDPYAYLQKKAQARESGQEFKPETGYMAQEEAQKLRGTAPQVDYEKARNALKSDTISQPQKPDMSGMDELERLKAERDYERQRADFERTQKEARQKDLGSVSGQVSKFGDLLMKQQSKVQDLINNLNSQRPGLGNQVEGALNKLASSGAEGNLDDSTLKEIEQIALETPPEELSQEINQATTPEGPQVSGEAYMAPEVPVPKKQQYQSLKQSGMTSAQIVQQKPELAQQVVPDGSIMNPNTGVGIVQTPMGEAYQLPSGLVVPRDPATGFYNLSALSAEDQKKLSYSDILAMDLSTKKTASDLKAMYNAQTFQQMAQRNEREYKIAELQLDSFYNAENNRLNEDQVKNMQTLEIERLRQELSKDTSIKKLDEAKSKTANIMKAQMDAWGLEGSSAALASMSAHSLKFEQEASLITQTYDINVKELALASSQVQMEFTNRVTELNQQMQVQKLDLRSEYINKKDEIDRSVLLSNIEKITEQQNMYSEYAANVYQAEQEAQAAAAEAEKAAQAEMWEKQKYYAEQLGMLVSVGQDGSVSPLLDEDGNPVETLSGRKFTFEREKYGMDYSLRERQFALDEQKFGFDAEMRMAEFDFNKEKFGLEYAMEQDKFGFEQGKWKAEFDQENEQFWAQMSAWDLEKDENGNYIGTNAMGEIVNFGALGVAVPTNSKHEFTTGPDEVRWNIPTNKNGVMESRGECGMLVNDALFGGSGNGGVGNSFESKMRLNNSPGQPVAGGAFFEKIIDKNGNEVWTGHTGLVEKVNRNPDGSIASFEIKESNYHGTWKVTSETVYPGSSRWKSIVEQGGFYDPLKGGTSRKEGQTGVSGDGPYANYVKELMGSGMSKTDAIELANDKMASGQIGGTEQDKTKEELLKLITKVKTSPGLSIGVGKSRYISGATGEGANFNADFESLKSKLTLENLSLMSGTLTDKDIEILSSAASSLSASMTEEKFRQTLSELELNLRGIEGRGDELSYDAGIESLQNNQDFVSYYNTLPSGDQKYVEKMLKDVKSGKLNTYDVLNQLGLPSSSQQASTDTRLSTSLGYSLPEDSAQDDYHNNF